MIEAKLLISSSFQSWNAFMKTLHCFPRGNRLHALHLFHSINFKKGFRPLVLVKNFCSFLVAFVEEFVFRQKERTDIGNICNSFMGK